MTAESDTGTMLTVTFNKSYTVAPIVVLGHGNNQAAGNSVVDKINVTSTTTSFSIIFDGAFPSPFLSYTWYYHVYETQ